ncbi:hypothetical protein G7046_g7171 [Stylonectria norvegica]|nr:hypothetical protein G7046_g7171 [Stylonectria norvegica]
MASQGMRLRLVIRRHAVPEVKLVWPCNASEDLTIAKLLAQVNDVVHLESGEWGLEDYVVELADDKGGSFECLHFQSVAKIFKDDDQVFIRSLLTEDLKRRRLSGRHQISTDGKHLIDGLAFGRPWLRVPRDRPVLDLPPRKRARIEYDPNEDDDENDEDEDDGEYEDDQVYELVEDQPKLLLEGPQEYDEDEPSSIAIRAVFDDADADAENEDEDEDDEFVPGVDVQSDPAITEPVTNDTAQDPDEDSDDEIEINTADIDEELQFLNADNALIGDINDESENDEPENDEPENETADILAAFNLDLSSLDIITALRQAFPLTPVTTIETEFLRCGKDLRRTYYKLTKSNEPMLSFDITMDRAVTGFPQSPKPLYELEKSIFKGLSSQDSGSTGFRGFSSPARPLIEEVESVDDPVAQPLSTESEVATSATLNLSRSTEEDLASEEDETSSSDSSSDSDAPENAIDSDDESSHSADGEGGNADASASSRPGGSFFDKYLDDVSSSEESSSSDSDSSDDGGCREANGASSHHISNLLRSVPSFETSDSSNSDSDDDSDDDDEAGRDVGGASSSDDSSDDSSADDSSSSDDESDSAPEPEEITSKSIPNVKNPQPQLVKEVLVAKEPLVAKRPQTISQKTEPPIAPGCGLSKTQKRNARRREAKRISALDSSQSHSPMIQEATTEDPEFLARKKALLSVVNGETFETTEKLKPVKQPSTTETKRNRDDKISSTSEDASIEETPVSATAQNGTPHTGTDSSQRKHKVDMGAGRRLLFGALGLKTPKSKEDEEKLRNNLMNEIKPLKTSSQDAALETDSVKNDSVEVEEDSELWRKNISYRAVECCYQGMVLSEPPFPFMQRWDPQQQYGLMKKRKRASQEFTQETYDDSYYGEDSQWYENEAEVENGNAKKKKKKSKKRKSKVSHEDEDTFDSPFAASEEVLDANIILNYDDTPAKGRPGSSQFTDIDDLPSLPADLTTLPTLQVEEVKPGMVITWTQLLMSKATNWAPKLASVTGIVISTVSEDNKVSVMLAKRDRENDKVYDQYSGKRVYDRFEAPDSDGEDEDDDGKREVAWVDMTEPRLVQEARPLSSLDETSQKVSMSDFMIEVNKVSESRDRDESKAEELDTQDVRAGMEAELKEMTAKQGESDNSTSIPSAQNPPRLEITATDTDPQTNTSAENTNDRANSPSRQLEETVRAAVAQEETPSAQIMEETSVDQGEGEHGYKDDHGEEDAEPDSMDVDGVELGVADIEGSEPDAIIPDSMASLDIPARKENKDSRLTPTVDYPMLMVPSSVSSIRSGRQPTSNYGLGESLDDDEVIPDTTPRAHETTPTPQGPILSNILGSSSPLPSLEEIYHTAATSRQTQSPLKSTQNSVLQSLRPRGSRGNAEYEEAMRKLDEGDEESDHSYDKNRSIRSLFPNATQPDASLDLPKLPSPRPETPKKFFQLKRETRGSPFVVPEGSQIIEVMSSSPGSAHFTEDYAQDSIDETYQDSSLPKGSGWVKKQKNDVTRRETRSRGKSLPAAPTTSESNTSTRRTGLSRKSMPGPIPNTSAVSGFKGRRKTSLKF